MAAPKTDATIWYLFHSGFAVETPRHFLIFDYYIDRPEGEARSLAAGVVEPAEIADRDVIVFVSHRHSDHYNPVIFRWREKIAKIRYVLPPDIRPPQGVPGVLATRAGQRYDAGDFAVRTLLSTDEGVAYAVEIDGLRIFHAGDLNWWHWEGEPDEDNRKMGEDFRREIGRIAGTRFDLGFFPLDPRLENQYAWGFDYFMRQTRTAMAFPMHFGTETGVCARLLADPVSRPYRERVQAIARRGQLFHYDGADRGNSPG